MAFGKKSKGKKDKKGKKGKADEWTFEGGTKHGEKKVTHDERGKLLHRVTQEKDEKERRGLLKMMDNNRKRAIEKRMSNKVQFNDFLTNDDVESGSEEEESETRKQKRQRKEIAGAQSSSLTVLQRLQKFSTGKSANHKDTLISQFMTESDSDDEEQEEEDAGDIGMSNNVDEDDVGENSENDMDDDMEDMEDEAEEGGVDVVDGDSDDEEGGSAAVDTSPYSWFFDSESKYFFTQFTQPCSCSIIHTILSTIPHHTIYILTPTFLILSIS